ncbi:hypothetical protein GCM10017673_09140 [Streptosporangium violaceochromogenes]|nr:hypothetical protein GCM10017673_09140 [Streptosporangium violaceochromogenes]
MVTANHKAKDTSPRLFTGSLLEELPPGGRVRPASRGILARLRRHPRLTANIRSVKGPVARPGFSRERAARPTPAVRPSGGTAARDPTAPPPPAGSVHPYPIGPVPSRPPLLFPPFPGLYFGQPYIRKKNRRPSSHTRHASAIMEASPHIDLIHQDTLGENTDKPIERPLCPIK